MDATDDEGCRGMDTSRMAGSHEETIHSVAKNDHPTDSTPRWRKTTLFPSELGIRQRAMSQIRITDKRLIPQIKEYLEQSVGSLVTESSIVDYLTSRFPELFVAVPSQR